MDLRRQGPPVEETSVGRRTPLPGSSAKVAHPPLPRLSSAARVSGIFDRLSTRLSVSALPPISRDKTLANMSTIMRQQLELAPRSSSTRTSASRMDEASAARACTAHTTPHMRHSTCMHCTHLHYTAHACTAHTIYTAHSCTADHALHTHCRRAQPPSAPERRLQAALNASPQSYSPKPLP